MLCATCHVAPVTQHETLRMLCDLARRQDCVRSFAATHKPVCRRAALFVEHKHSPEWPIVRLMLTNVDQAQTNALRFRFRLPSPAGLCPCLVSVRRAN